MSTTLAATALLMGLAGGPHCIAMCGAACGGITRAGASGGKPALWTFQLGRLAGYAAAGAVAAAAVQGFSWITTQAAALRPLWTFFHLAVLAWGLMLAFKARQPMWVSAAGRGAWTRMRRVAPGRGGVLVTGALWAFMPCGLLYSALLVASLTGGPVEGALAMALFALGGAASLMLAPALYAKLERAGNRWQGDAGTRIAGCLLALSAVWALWIDLAHRVAVWCGLA